MVCSSCEEADVCEDLSGHNILVVEDDRTLSRLIETVLKSAGLNVFMANSLSMANNIICAEKIDLIILDNVLPDGQGSTWLHYKQKKYPDIPVIMITGDDSRELTHYALTIEADVKDVIIKPFSPSILKLRIKETLSGLKLKQECYESRIKMIAAEDASKIKTDFMRVLGHELGAPLTPILALELILEEPDLVHEPDGRSMITRALEGASSIERIKTRALRIISIRDEKNKPNLEKVDAKRVVETIAYKYEQKAHDNGLSFSCDVEKNFDLWTDSSWLSEALEVLTRNALRFSKKGRICIDIRQENTKGIIEVKDTGIGISTEHVQEIFNAFNQVDMSKARLYGGVGLGLTLAKELINSIGGNISVASEYGEGSSFKVMLPLFTGALHDR